MSETVKKSLLKKPLKPEEAKPLVVRKAPPLKRAVPKAGEEVPAKPALQKPGTPIKPAVVVKPAPPLKPAAPKPGAPAPAKPAA
ncbi:MAG: hypothetical protein ACXWGZ_11300, partial [Candidatus Aminicenantales bacterium]